MGSPLGVSQGPGASGKESALAVPLEVPETPFALFCAVRGDGGGAPSREEDGLPGDRKPLRKRQTVEGDCKRPGVWESRARSHPRKVGQLSRTLGRKDLPFQWMPVRVVGSPGFQKSL